MIRDHWINGNAIAGKRVMVDMAKATELLNALRAENSYLIISERSHASFQAQTAPSPLPPIYTCDGSAVSLRRSL